MKIAIVMGSDSDLHVMEDAFDVLKEFEIAFHTQVLSAHRTPEDMINFGNSAKENGFEIIIAGAGGAAHLPGMLASTTTLPVIGVPIKLKTLDGMDSLLSIVQMPKGVPVATVAINNAHNAALLALSILALKDNDLDQKLLEFKKSMADKSRAKNPLI
jgi:5-(carboxyamino)imidazole ribonucleotide mutase